MRPLLFYKGPELENGLFSKEEEAIQKFKTVKVCGINLMTILRIFARRA